MARLSIQHTRQWEDRNLLKSTANLANADEALNFVLEVKANPDVWLVGGQRRAQFSCTEGEIKIFSIIMIPLQAGRLLLPSVEVRPQLSPRQYPNAPERTETPASPHLLNREPRGQDVPFTCDLDYQSRGETVTVLSDRQSTTAALFDGGRQPQESQGAPEFRGAHSSAPPR